MKRTLKFDTSLKWYISSTALFLVPLGIQAVLYPWLIVVYLGETPARVGLAQMAGSLPMLILILFGGWLGDRMDQRRLSLILIGGMSLLPLMVVSLFYFDLVVYELVVLWVVCVSILNSFAQPARDAMLTRVAGDNIQQAVTLVVGVQFGVQIVGFAIGSSAEVFGPSSLFICQALFMLCAALATARLPAMPVPARDAMHTSPLTDIRAGLVMAWQSDKIKPAVVFILGVGLFFVASYLVILPLMVRDLYDGGAPDIAGAYAANMFGICTVIIFVMRRGGVERPGKILITGGVISSLSLMLLHFAMPQWLFYVVIYLWGLGGGVGMTLSRAIVQEASPPAYRARLISVYSLGMLAGAPIGAAFIGYCIGYMGVRNAVLIPGIGMLLTLLYLYLGTGLYDMHRPAGPLQPAD